MHCYPAWLHSYSTSFWLQRLIAQDIKSTLVHHFTITGPQPSDLEWSGWQYTCKIAILQGASGGMLLRKILKFRGYAIASETTFGLIRCFSEANDRVSHECHSAHCVVHQWCRLPIQFAYWPKATPFTGEACETSYHSLVRTENCWKTRGTVLSHCSQPSHKFQHGTYVLRGAG